MENTTTILPSKAAIEDAIVRAYDAIKNASKTDTSNIGESMTKYSDALQGVLNNFLSKRGAITQEQLDELDEQIRQTKLKTLQSESKNTLVRYGIFISIVVIGFGALWLITKEKQNG